MNKIFGIFIVGVVASISASAADVSSAEQRAQQMAQCATLANQMDKLLEEAKNEAAQNHDRFSLSTKLQLDDQNKKAEIISSCQNELTKAQETIVKLGPDYFILGISLFSGIEINAPAKIVKSLVPQARFGIGVSMFLTNSTAPKFGFLMTQALGAELSQSMPSVFEPQAGFIVYIGSTHHKTITQDFDGLYFGLTGELANPTASELMNTKSYSGSVMVNTKKSIIIAGARSFTAGKNVASVGIGALNIHNVTPGPQGASVSDIFGVLKDSIVNSSSNAADGALNIKDAAVTKYQSTHLFGSAPQAAVAPASAASK